MRFIEWFLSRSGIPVARDQRQASERRTTWKVKRPATTGRRRSFMSRREARLPWSKVIFPGSATDVRLGLKPDLRCRCERCCLFRCSVNSDRRHRQEALNCRGRWGVLSWPSEGRSAAALQRSSRRPRVSRASGAFVIPAPRRPSIRRARRRGLPWCRGDSPAPSGWPSFHHDQVDVRAPPPA
jgi:hypothetical protein